MSNIRTKRVPLNENILLQLAQAAIFYVIFLKFETHQSEKSVTMNRGKATPLSNNEREFILNSITERIV